MATLGRFPAAVLQENLESEPRHRLLNGINVANWFVISLWPSMYSVFIPQEIQIEL